MAGFYSARSSIMPPLPWPTFAPPLSHEVHAVAFCRDRNGVIYALGPTVRHIKRQHLATYGDGEFWHSIRVGREADAWEWGKRLGD